MYVHFIIWTDIDDIICHLSIILTFIRNTINYAQGES